MSEPRPSAMRLTDEQRADLPALAALVLLDVVAATCLGRLFNSPEALRPILVAVLIGHGVAYACRYRNLAGGPSVAAAASAAVLSAMWLVVPQHTLYGLPTMDALRAISDGLSEARHQFGVAIAPAAPIAGFTIACVLAVVMLASLADWAAFRIRATIEAAVPAFTLFVFAAVLGTAHHRANATIFFFSALVVWFVAHNATVIARTRPWFHGTADAGRKAMSRAGVGIGTLGLVGALIGVAIPFTQDPPAVAWRNRTRTHARTTISPLVDIRTRLVARSDVVAFTVETPLRAYWRLTSLNVFDGDIWSSHGSYKDVDPDESFKNREGVVSTQRFSIADLKSIWLPVAYRPSTSPSIEGISHDDNADAFITEQPTSDSLVYEVKSAVREFTPDSLRRARPVGVDDEEIALPDTLDPRVAALATQITQGLATPYEKAFAIQQYLRSSPFRYDLSVPAGHSDDALARFLFVTRRGYCEQFAGSFAVLARLAGLPTRVAVGFTQGERDESTGLMVVRELNAHAWPEVFLGSAGWVAFEPTPGRGIPGAQSYTGAVESQADSRRPTAASTLVPTTVREDPNAGAPASPATTTTVVTPTTSPSRNSGQSSPLLRIFAMILIALVVIGAIVAIVPLTMAARRRRRWSAASTPTDKVLVAWTDTDEALRFAGAPVRRSHTPTERIASAAPAISEGAVATLTRLAEMVDVAAYAPEDAVSTTDAEEAWRDAGDVRREAFATKSRWKYALFAIDPRRLRRR
jgi:transglutaminase-like putative cysteine protease